MHECVTTPMTRFVLGVVLALVTGLFGFLWSINASMSAMSVSLQALKKRLDGLEKRFNSVYDHRLGSAD